MRRFKVLRLLHVINETGSPYNQFSLAMADHQDITICSYFKPRITVDKRIRLFAGDNTLLGFVRALKSALTADRYDIVHAHTPYVGFLFVVVSMLTDFRLLRSAVYTVHSSYQHYELRHRLLLIGIFACFGRVVSCSQASFVGFPRFFRWLGKSRFVAIQNGVDIDRIDRIIGPVHPKLDLDGLTILFVGRLIQLKRPDIVLDAFREVRGERDRLVLIGDGNLRSFLASRIIEYGLEQQVEITGLIPREQVYQYMAAADLYVSASSVEGLPVAVLEAMACRCPVILSDIPPHREITGGADFVPLVRPDDVMGFVETMKRLRAMSLPERVDIGCRCRQLAEEEFALTTMHRKYGEIYAQLLDRRDRGRPYL